MIGGIIQKIKNTIVNKYIGSLVRTLLAALIGALAVSSIPGAAEIAEVLKENMPVLETAIGTALGYLFIQLWSWIQKWRSQPKAKDSVVLTKKQYEELLEKTH